MNYLQEKLKRDLYKLCINHTNGSNIDVIQRLIDEKVNDKLITSTSYSNSFSMAKSYLSAAIGVAIKEGKIKSVNQKIKDFLPWFNNSELNKSLTIKSLLTMTV